MSGRTTALRSRGAACQEARSASHRHAAIVERTARLQLAMNAYLDVRDGRAA